MSTTSVCERLHLTGNLDRMTNFRHKFQVHHNSICKGGNHEDFNDHPLGLTADFNVKRVFRRDIFHSNRIFI